MGYLAIIFMWLAATIVSAQAAEPIAETPYRIDYDGLLTVQVTVNGHGPYDFVIDTGSTLTVAFENLAALENFEPTGGANLRVLGISSVEELPPFRLGTIGFGAATLPNHIGIIIPDWQAPRDTPRGVLGLDFLRRYAVYFDRVTQTMTLYPHGGIPDHLIDGFARIKLQPRDFGKASGALFTTRGAINRKPVTFIVDFGSASSLINYRAAEAIYSSVVLKDTGFGSTTGSRLRDIFDDRSRARIATLKHLRIGRLDWRSLDIWVYNAEIFDELGVQDYAYGLAGIDLLGNRNFALDFGENNMFVAKKSRSATPRRSP